MTRSLEYSDRQSTDKSFQSSKTHRIRGSVPANSDRKDREIQTEDKSARIVRTVRLESQSLNNQINRLKELFRQSVLCGQKLSLH